jgi:hypothetical protein
VIEEGGDGDRLISGEAFGVSKRESFFGGENKLVLDFDTGDCCW